MIPLRDTIPPKRFAFFNYALIFVNALFFVFEVRMGRKLEPFILRYGLVPAVWTNAALAQHLSFVRQTFPTRHMHVSAWELDARYRQSLVPFHLREEP